MSTNIYSSAIDDCNARLRILRRKLNLMATIRLALFTGLLYSLYSLLSPHAAYLPWISLLLFAAFVVCINIYYRLKDQRTLAEKLLWVNTNELGIQAGEVNGFPDGASYLDNDNYLDDLDIFGKRSLFHVLNRTTTSHGSRSLVGLLRTSFLSAAAILRQQQAIRSLFAQAPLLRQLIATGLATQEKTGNLELEDWLTTAPRLYNRPALRIAIGVLTVFNLIAIYLFFSSNNYTLPALAILISWSLKSAFAGYINQQHQLISHKQALLDQYAGILSVFSTVQTADSALLQELQARTVNANKAIRQLSRLAGYFDQRMNLLVNTLLNSFFYYDLQCMIAVERWKMQHRDSYMGWIDTVGLIESLTSLSTFAFNNPEYNYPVPAETVAPAATIPTAGTSPAAPSLFIEAVQLAHPLMPATQRVANDFTIGRQERLILVTGSNMSGKTTFLRTIGVNLLLAQCGAPVCAGSFSFTPMLLLTSLRISDSLQEQTSYFMAELKKLQKIVHSLQTGAPALVLIDEILRGTNSEDKTHGSELFIRKLLTYNCLSLFATHDLSLGQMEQELPGDVNNYCFESVIENGNLHFNYQLQRGIARNRNASFLMQRMEIV
jgi:hypothetical protein